MDKYKIFKSADKERKQQETSTIENKHNEIDDESHEHSFLETDKSISFGVTCIWMFSVLMAFIIIWLTFSRQSVKLIVQYLLSATIFMLTLFYMVEKKHGKQNIVLVLIMAIVGFLCIFRLRHNSLYSYNSDLVASHLPFFFLIIFGVGYTGSEIRNLEVWKSYIVFLAKGLFTAMTFIIAIQLHIYMRFDEISRRDDYLLAAMPELEEKLLELQIIICIVIFSFLAVHWVDKYRKFYKRIMIPLMILFQGMIVYYLIGVLCHEHIFHNYFEQNELSIYVSALLLSNALCIIFIFLKSSINKRTIFDYYILGGIIFNWVVDFMFLATIYKRLFSQITPFRISGLIHLGLLFLLLCGCIYLYGGFLFRKKEYIQLQKWTISFIPVFSIWLLFVITIFPIIFSNFNR